MAHQLDVEPSSAGIDDPFHELPSGLARSLAARQGWREAEMATDPVLGVIMAKLDRWRPSSTIRVAVSGGTTELYRRIIEVVSSIEEACSLRFDFGFDGHGVRSWSPDDCVHAADIRIGFDYPRSWSLVGTASADWALGSPEGGGQPCHRSMNLAGFDREVPEQWRGVVLRMFLRAVGFAPGFHAMCEHCQGEFRWEDDQWYVPTRDRSGRLVADPHGRRPGIYTWMAGPPNEWSRERVDRNLRASQAGGPSSCRFDSASVMAYPFVSVFCRANPKPCVPVGDGETLSPGDRRRLGALYPTDHQWGDTSYGCVGQLRMRLAAIDHDGARRRWLESTLALAERLASAPPIPPAL